MSDAVQPTAAEVRAAADALKEALDRHLAAVERRASEPGPAADTEVFTAFNELAAAGEVYDEMLYEVHDEVTPFEVPGTDATVPYAGPEDVETLSVLVRRDYTVADQRRLLAQAQRVTELDPEAVDEDEPGGLDAAGHSLHAALGVLFGEFEPDEIATRHAEFGLEEGDATTWVVAGEDRTEPGEWLAAPFDGIDPERVICRFDVSDAFEEDEDEAETLS